MTASAARRSLQTVGWRWSSTRNLSPLPGGGLTVVAFRLHQYAAPRLISIGELWQNNLLALPQTVAEPSVVTSRQFGALEQFQPRHCQRVVLVLQPIYTSAISVACRSSTVFRRSRAAVGAPLAAAAQSGSVLIIGIVYIASERDISTGRSAGSSSTGARTTPARA